MLTFHTAVMNDTSDQWWTKPRTNDFYNNNNNCINITVTVLLCLVSEKLRKQPKKFTAERF